MTDRLAVDIGGTFTDVVLETGGRIESTKVLTTHTQPAAAVVQGLGEVLARAGREPKDLAVVLHGTTLATNALIERRGARTALVTTEGHRDVLEMAYENRFEQYDVNVDRPPPLVPRRWRFTVPERMNAAGEVLAELSSAAVSALVPALQAAGIESVAVGFLHAYANPAHERLVRDMLGEALPALSVTLASEVCPEIREYERFSTACANAYVRPLMATYLADLQQRLQALGVVCPLLLMTSGGGLASLATARRFPIRLVESGPAGGAILAARIARQLELPRAALLDMGGTTAKICLVDDGAPQQSRAFEVARSYRFRRGSGLPVRVPVIEMVEIGAGGGSIATVDRLGRVQVGPQSAGSEPGPACYGRGGCQATVTDADMVLGRLDAERFAAGTIALDERAAARAIERHVALPWQGAAALDVPGAAAAVGEVVDENMAAAARAHAAEWGREMAGRTLIALGGAAPIHAPRLMAKLDLAAVLVPADAGVGSAVGFLAAPVAYEVVRSRHVRLSALDPEDAAATMAEMREEALAVVAPVASGPLEETRQAFMRYVGQGYEIAVPAPEQPERKTLRAAFDRAYEALYGRLISGLDVEVLSWTLTLTAPSPAPASGRPPAGRRRGIVDKRRVLRHRLAPGDRVHGPANIVEDQTVVVVGAGQQAEMDEYGNLLVTARG